VVSSVVLPQGRVRSWGALSVAAVGGVAGAATGSQPPPKACSYVVTEKVATVKTAKEFVVGETSPATVELHTIRDTETHVFASVNDRE
jgi:hypothetical protein